MDTRKETGWSCGQSWKSRLKAGGPGSLLLLPPSSAGPRLLTLTLLIGFIDGPDFSVGASGQNFNESLFICASSLEGPDKDNVSHSPDPQA